MLHFFDIKNIENERSKKTQHKNNITLDTMNIFHFCFDLL